MEAESIGSRLATARHAAGLSQPALAAAIGLDPVRGSLVVSRYERGASRIPLCVAARLAAALDVPIAWLAEG